MFDSDTGGTSWWSPGTRLVYLFMALLTCGLAYLQQPSLGFMTVVLITCSGLVLLVLCFYLGFSFGFWLSSKGISQFKGKVKGKFKRQSPQCFLGFWKRSLNLMQISFGKKAPPAAIKALKKRNNLAMRVSGMGKQVGKVVPPRVLPTGAQKTLLGGTGAGWVLHGSWGIFWVFSVCQIFQHGIQRKVLFWISSDCKHDKQGIFGFFWIFVSFSLLFLCK